MRKLSKKQRADIYLKVAIHLATVEDYWVCSILAEKLGVLISEAEYILPEFWLFQPSMKEYNGSLSWWKEDANNNRIQALLFCYEMCNS